MTITFIYQLYNKVLGKKFLWRSIQTCFLFSKPHLLETSFDNMTVFVSATKCFVLLLLKFFLIWSYAISLCCAGKPSAWCAHHPPPCLANRGCWCLGPMGAAGWRAGGTAQVDLGFSQVGAVPHVPKAVCALMSSSLLV